ncbi:ABC transporter permease [Dyella psychrodurans]|uniref:ABC transporter permease n=1 Tax=Dyella psychrodurans TaxID=1927960 RepID=A0A370X223_9GAMM|nr:FtsX-like permease family protein [Dyella psychrodurans]RDS82464.1 ABC transporter permease [Dyella psychrodurans]
MDIRPILSTLRRHKFTACLLIAEIALTCAIVCNAVFLIGQRLERMDMTTGIAEHELVYVHMAYIGMPSDGMARSAADVAALRQITGVKSVTMMNQIPFGDSSSNMGLRIDQTQQKDTINSAQYFGENMVQTYGLQVVAGRDFQPEEYQDLDKVFAGLRKGDLNALPKSALVTQAVANRLWPGQSPLGKQVYVGQGIPLTVVGVLKQLARPNQFEKGAQYSVINPIRIAMSQGAIYVLRCAPQDRDQVLKEALAKLKALDPNRIVLNKGTEDQLRHNYFRNDRAMAGILLGVCIALLVVTALGIVGLASFWVAQRNRSIGVRRALGATRRNILSYFQTENFLLTTIGIALGMVLAYGINLFLIMHYELPRLPAIYFPIGAVTLWAIGQAAVLGPALRAAAVPPVVATRSV